MKKHRTELYVNRYQTYNRLFNKLKRILKQNYFNDMIINYQSDMKRTWEVLKKAMGKNIDKRKPIIDIIYDNKK